MKAQRKGLDVNVSAINKASSPKKPPRGSLQKKQKQRLRLKSEKQTEHESVRET